MLINNEASRHFIYFKHGIHLQQLHRLDFLIAQQTLFAELILNQHLILFVYSNQLLLVYNDF